MPKGLFSYNKNDEVSQFCVAAIGAIFFMVFDQSKISSNSSELRFNVAVTICLAKRLGTDRLYHIGKHYAQQKKLTPEEDSLIRQEIRRLFSNPYTVPSIESTLEVWDIPVSVNWSSTS